MVRTLARPVTDTEQLKGEGKMDLPIAIAVAVFVAALGWGLFVHERVERRALAAAWRARADEDRRNVVEAETLRVCAHELVGGDPSSRPRLLVSRSIAAERGFTITEAEVG